MGNPEVKMGAFEEKGPPNAALSETGDARTPAAFLGKVPPVIRALLIEDDRKLSALVVEFLAQHGVNATPAADATQALRALEAERFDILLVDLMLPGMDGLTLTRRVRERWGTPIIMVTARGDDADKIVGLELGADDYLAKPFNPRELLARVRAVLRRSLGDAPTGPSRFTSGGLAIDFDAREVTVDGVRQQLTAHEFDSALRVGAQRRARALARSAARAGQGPGRRRRGVRSLDRRARQPAALEDRARPATPALRQDGARRRVSPGEGELKGRLYLKLYLAFLGVLLAIVVVSAAIALLFARSFPLVRAGPRVALHLARSLPAPDDRLLQHEVSQASDELGLDVAVIGLDGKELAHAGQHIDAPPVDQLSRLRSPGWVAPGLVSAPLRRPTEQAAARAADERKRAVDAEHPPVRLAPLAPLAPAPRFAPPPERPGDDGPPSRWESDEERGEPPVAVVLVRVPVPGNPAQVWGARTLAFLLGALLVSAALLDPLSRSITLAAGAARGRGRGVRQGRPGAALGRDRRGRGRSGEPPAFRHHMAGRIERARRAEKERPA